MPTDKHKYKKVLISGGGTGGHIFPAIAIANALRRKEPDIDILFVGAEGRMEMERVPAAGYKIIGLPVAGFDRKHLWRNIPVIIKLLRSMQRARHILSDFKPDIAVGVGGYASGPMLKAAQKAGIPTVLQEQNSYAGVTNKLLAQHATAICVAYDGMQKFFPADKIIMTGNPVRATLFEPDLNKTDARLRLGLKPNKPTVFVTGGSLGARTINESIAIAADRITDSGAQILWQTGRLYSDKYAEFAIGNSSVKTMAFISDMAAAYRCADIVVSRAGAGTISELQLLGKPAILIPSPNVADDHQRKNAMALVEHNAAIMILDNNARTQLGDAILSLLADEPQRSELAARIKTMSLEDADNKIADTILKIAIDCNK